MTSQFKIQPLSQTPQFLEVRAAWSYGEWGCQDGQSYQDILDLSRNSLDETSLPITWFATYADKPAGMITLKETEHPDHENIGPWIGGVYVHPLFRKQGLATRLCDFAHHQAHSRGFDRTILTAYIPEIYERMGYETIGMARDLSGLRSEGMSLMQKTL